MSSNRKKYILFTIFLCMAFSNQTPCPIFGLNTLHFSNSLHNTDRKNPISVTLTRASTSGDGGWIDIDITVYSEVILSGASIQVFASSEVEIEDSVNGIYNLSASYPLTVSTKCRSSQNVGMVFARVDYDGGSFHLGAADQLSLNGTYKPDPVITYGRAFLDRDGNTIFPMIGK